MFVSLAARLREAVVGGSVLECLVFGALGADTLWIGITLNGRVDAFGNDLNFLGAAVTLALAAGFGIGALLMNFQWFEARIVGARIMGAVLHLGATAVAVWGAIWLGLFEHVDPTTDGWSQWIAFAIVALVIATGFAVLASLLLPAISRALKQVPPTKKAEK
jgi:hypothetical protein